jgi:Ca2+-transporting ATPase
MKNDTIRSWYAVDVDDAVQALETDAERGLDAAETAARILRFGYNRLTPVKGKHPLVMFLAQFSQPLVVILLAAAVITLFLREFVDSSVIFGVVLVNAIVGFVQELKALRAIDALAKTIKTEALVLREGQTRKIGADGLVPGDVVLIASGDKVPADLRLIGARDLQADESALTGESLPVQKQTGRLPEDTLLAERTNMAYASSLVTFGRAKGVVVATGDSTEVGRISKLLHETEELKTPLTVKIEKFSHLLLIAILTLAGLTFAVGIMRGGKLSEMFMAAVALAVGAIPEGLPAAITIILAIGVSRMAKRRAIIRKLPAVETLGSTTIICSDKTGTLTENQMTVREIFAGGRKYDVTGQGYVPEGTILDGTVVFDASGPAPLRETLLCGLLCNDSSIKDTGERWITEGDPTEGALLASARKLGLSEDPEKAAYRRVDAIPFESEHQYMATLHSTAGADSRVVYIKGSVESVLQRCPSMMREDGSASPAQKEEIAAMVNMMAARGLRVLAFARNVLPAGHDRLSHADVDSGMTFLGLQGMIDPPREEAIEAIGVCYRAGIGVKMITGDHAVTAAAIAREMGFKGESAAGMPVSLTGRDLAGKEGQELADIAEKVSVFARVTPEQKLRLVESLQLRGHVVAMTGDGVNDAPALKKANIGVAMGLGGTDVAREAADMILTDDNFASIKAAVEEGRGVFDNLTKFILWTLPTNLGEGLIILTAILVGGALPILPVQILWINMTTALLLGMMLAFEPLEKDVMTRPPRDPRVPILTPVLVLRMLGVSACMLAAAYALFRYEKSIGHSLALARTTTVNVFVMVELFYLFNCRSLLKSVFAIGAFSNWWTLAGAAGMILLQMLFTYHPFMNRIFHTEPIPFVSWALIFGAAITVHIVVEIEKRYRRLRNGRQPQHRIE